MYVSVCMCGCVCVFVKIKKYFWIMTKVEGEVNLREEESCLVYDSIFQINQSFIFAKNFGIYVL